jgi:Tfp pilus assembly protein FimT
MKSNLRRKNLYFKLNNLGFSLVELIIVVGMMSTLSGLMLPSFLNWIRTEKVNAYTRELREYFRVVRLEARRWGTNCQVSINSIDHNSVKNDKEYQGYSITCGESSSKIKALAPSINNSIFQVMNQDFLITPNGRISSDKAIIIVIGSKYHMSGSKILNCLIIKSPTGHIVKGKFLENNWIINKMKVSSLDQNNILSPEKCMSS